MHLLLIVSYSCGTHLYVMKDIILCIKTHREITILILYTYNNYIVYHIINIKCLHYKSYRKYSEDHRSIVFSIFYFKGCQRVLGQGITIKLKAFGFDIAGRPKILKIFFIFKNNLLLTCCKMRVNMLIYTLRQIYLTSTFFVNFKFSCINNTKFLV